MKLNKNYKRGDLVICVDGFLDILKKGRVYTINKFTEVDEHTSFIKLKEVEEYHWSLYRFKKLKNKKLARLLYE